MNESAQGEPNAQVVCTGPGGAGAPAGASGGAAGAGVAGVQPHDPVAASQAAEAASAYADSEGYSLAMRVMQSDLYPKLDAAERAECDEFIRRGQAGLTLPAVVQVEPDLSQLNALAKVYASSYASPHHVTFTVEGLRNLIASLEHQAAPSSPKAQAPAPFSEPRALGQGELPVRAEMEKDAARLDWVEQNLFHREMDDWDSRTHKATSMWVLFAPQGVQGSARRIIDAAIAKEQQS